MNDRYVRHRVARPKSKVRYTRYAHADAQAFGYTAPEISKPGATPVPFDQTAARFAPQVLSIIRIVAALLFFEHGTSRLFGFPSAMPAPPFLTLYWFAGALELACGVLVALGLFTRAAAFIASGEMAFAYFMSHAPHSFFPILNRGDAAILYCFVFLYIAFAGPGPWSLDGLWQRKA